VGRQRDNTAHTTDDDSRYRFAVYPTTRSQNNPAAAGHSRRARRSPGRSPGTTDFASRPGFPHDLGWGPLQNGREQRYRRRPSAQPAGVHAGAGLPTLVNAYRVATVHRVAGARERGTALSGAGPRPPRRRRSTVGHALAAL